MPFYHPKWIKEAFTDNKGKFLYQLNSAEITELHEALINFLSIDRIAENWDRLVKLLR